jgi:hypothetical protein
MESFKIGKGEDQVKQLIGMAKKHPILTVIAIFIVIGTWGNVLSSFSSGSSTVPSAQAVQPTVTQASAPVNKQEAEGKLSSFMGRSKQADLVTSYEFSDSASVVYIGSAWYTMTVVQKKDFIAYVANLKEAVTGYRHLEVRDAYSNEKVAEVTSFSGSLEVYK